MQVSEGMLQAVQCALLSVVVSMAINLASGVDGFTMLGLAGVCACVSFGVRLLVWRRWSI